MGKKTLTQTSTPIQKFSSYIKAAGGVITRSKARDLEKKKKEVVYSDSNLSSSDSESNTVLQFNIADLTMNMDNTSGTGSGPKSGKTPYKVVIYVDEAVQRD